MPSLRQLRKWLVPALLIVGVGTWQLVSSRRPQPVETSTARQGELVAEWSAVGYVEAVTADITSPQIGRVERVKVREGDTVAAGALLAELDLQGARAMVSGADAGLAAARARGRSADALVGEFADALRERESRARTEVYAAGLRRDQAAAAYEAERRSAPARVAAARADVEAAQASLRDLEQGAREEERQQAAAEVSGAEASLRRARADLARAEELNQQGATAQRDVDAAREAVTLAQTALEVRRKAAALAAKGARADQVAAARARLRAAEAQVTVAEGLLANVDILADKVSEAKAAVRAAATASAETRTGRKRLQALRQDAEAALAGAQQGVAGLDQAQAAMGERLVRSPFAGVVSRRYVDPGDMASPQAPLFTVVDQGRIWVSAEVDEQDLAPIRVGRAVEVSASAYPGHPLPGHIARIGGAAVPQTEVRTGARIVRVRVELEGSAGRSLLKPGMEVHVAGRAVLASDCVLVASDAVTDDENGSFVWVAEQGVVRKRSVKAGRMSGRETEVRSGLRAGEKVVVSGKEALTEGLRAAPIPAAQK